MIVISVAILDIDALASPRNSTSTMLRTRSRKHLETSRRQPSFLEQESSLIAMAVLGQHRLQPGLHHHRRCPDDSWLQAHGRPYDHSNPRRHLHASRTIPYFQLVLRCLEWLRVVSSILLGWNFRSTGLRRLQWTKKQRLSNGEKTNAQWEAYETGVRKEVN